MYKFGNQVTTANSMANETTNDVIGSKTDTSFSNGSHTPSIIGHLVAGYNHVHNPSKIYPRTDNNNPLAALTLTGSATALTFGEWVEITNYDSKTLLSDVHHILISAGNANDEYVIQLGTGASGAQVFWGECGFIKDVATQPTSQIPIQGPPIPAGTKLWARLATTGGGSDTVKIKIYSHEYPPVTGA